MERAYLGRHLFDGERLRRRALHEFAGSVRSGRLIAFVGSYATEDLGYDSWNDFLKAFAEEAGKLCTKDGTQRREHAAKAIETIRARLADSGDAALTGLSVIEYALAYAGVGEDPLLSQLRAFGAERFRLPDLAPTRKTNVKRLLQDLSIDRIITLNYDLEFEWELMTSLGEKDSCGTKGRGRHKQFQALLDTKIIARDRCDSLTRILPNGKSIISDLFQRGRTDRLIEFAVGSPDYEAHILHLHGRQTDPESMIISQRDYNNQYRRSGVAKLPFEHALRILFAGNPILFVGVGMTEGDVTATLEQFISDHPDRRLSPVYVLWNGPDDDKKRNAMRFRWLHRFGALTLFDDELSAPPAPSSTDDAQKRLAASITGAGSAAARLAKRFDWSDKDLRRIGDKLRGTNGNAIERFDIWSTPPKLEDLDKTDPAHGHVADGAPIRLFIGEPGVGKGNLAKRLRLAWHLAKPGSNRRSCLINASFIFETDSVFSLISGLADERPAAEEGISRSQSLLSYLTDEDPREILLVINGMERFLSAKGTPLSSELDALVRRLIDVSALGLDDETADRDRSVRSPVTIYVLGTARVRHYFDALTERMGPLLARTGKRIGVELAAPATRTRSVYFEELMKRFHDRGCDISKLPLGAAARIEQKRGGDRTGLRRAVMSAYLQPDALRAAQTQSPDLCLDILAVMAMIGQPIESCVLNHCPRIRDRLRVMNISDAAPDARALLDRAIQDLVALNLLVPTGSFPGTPSSWERYGLHRSVLTEFRDRLGVPLSDAQLAAGFNVSMFVALPSEGYSPEHEIHEELGTLADWLTGAYKDEPLAGYAAIEDTGTPRRWQANRKLISTTMTRRSGADTMPELARAWPHVSACLRAALALLRTYYSTSTLLMVDPSNGVPRGDEDGPLTQHADRLDRIIRAAIANATARRDAEAALGPDARDWLGPSPYYADDLVWLHNERGVIKLAQGDLYEARLAFNEALQLNSEHIEFSERGQNWRRITLNQVHVDIDRAWLSRAEKRMSEIDDSIQDAFGESISDIRAAIIHRYGERCEPERRVVDPDYEHDIVLTIALMFGYRGLILHLQGQLQQARSFFEIAATILGNIGETRGYAVFQRHYTSLLTALGENEAAAQSMKMALASGEATKQTDIAYHARVAESAKRYATADTGGRGALVRQLRGALSYAEAGDMHRLRVEAGLNLARIRFQGGDFDVALEHAADAMATAARYGLNLRKISLRILIGQILISRGDAISGRALIEKAIKNADRVSYQQAVELAQRVLVTET